MWDRVRMRTILHVQEVEVHGWLLSGIEEDNVECTIPQLCMQVFWDEKAVV